MPALRASSDVLGFSMFGYSQIANVVSSPNIRNIGNYSICDMSHNANMYDDEDKNGGPNHLRAWMKFRGVKGAHLAESLGGNVTPGMVSDLVNSNRALSAKWLRRIAPHLRTTPGLLLDHDPFDLDEDMIDLWTKANDDQKHQIVDLAKVVIKGRTGTDGS